MKELSIEEKAKRYDEALTKARNIVNSINVGLIGKDSFEAVFPELQESEGERIRQFLIDFIKVCSWTEKKDQGWPLREDCIAWLEKQGEQNLANKVKPKFKVGDWLVNDYCKGKVIALTDDAYLLDTEQGIPFSYEHNAHLWTIQDAKNGDVIYLPNGNDEYYIFIFKGIENAAVMSFAHFYQYNDGTSEVEGTIDNLSSVNDVFQPATKEQCDLLFNKMCEAGYEWDADKKELKEIIDKKQIKNNLQDNSFRRMFEQKSTEWSEKDGDYINDLIEYFSQNERLKNTEEDIVIWLKSLKERVGG